MVSAVDCMSLCYVMLRYVNSKFTEFDTSVIYHVLILCFCSFLLEGMSFKVLSIGSARTKSNNYIPCKHFAYLRSML